MSCILLLGMWCALPASAQPSNDLCSTATPVTAGSMTNATNVASTSDLPSTACAYSPTDDRDVWFSFTAPSAAVYYIDTNGSLGLLDTTLSVWTLCPPGGVMMACDDDGGTGLLSAVAVNLAAGQTVYIRVAGWNHLVGTFMLRVSSGVPPPTNDLCTNALPVTPGVPVNGTTVNATGLDVSSCATADWRDVWYWFTAPITGVYPIDTIGSGTLVDTTLALYDACEGTSLGCNDDLETGNFRSALTVQLTAGQLCLVRVSGYQGTSGTFTLRVHSPTPGIANDGCDGAVIVLTLPFFDSGGEITAASNDADLSACHSPSPGPVRNGLWYVYDSPVAQFIRVRDLSGLGTFVSVLSSSTSTCAGPFTELACAAGGADAIVPLSMGARVYILVGLTDSAMPVSPSFINLSVENVPPPPNDTCAQAIDLVSPIQVLATNVGAGSTISGTPCASPMNNRFDVWFRFVPSVAGHYLIDTRGAAGSLMDTTLSIWQACPATGTPLFCNDNFNGGKRAALNVPLAASTAFYIRVAGASQTFGDFPLSIGPGVVTSNDACNSAISISPGHLVGSTDTAFALQESAQPAGTCNTAGTGGLCNSVWYKFVPGSTGVLLGTISSPGSNQVVVLFSGSCSSLTQVACFSGPVADLSGVTVNAGQVYLLAIGAACGGVAGPTMLDLDIPAAPPTGACCRGVSCVQTIAADCTGQHTSFAGVGTVCNINPDNVGPCCRGDFNKSGAITVQDIFDFLAAYFGQSPYADVTGNGLSVQDIFDFLRSYFSTC